jgi:subtilisin family serine protease
MHCTRLSVLTALAGVALITACRDEALLPVDPLMSATTGPARSISHVGTLGSSRRDNPWTPMTDVELADKVKLARGRVFIGFKEATATDGVTDDGHVLVSASTVKAAKAELRGIAGVAIEREYALVPALVATLPTQAVAGLRHNPNVDYIEPIFPGTRFSQDTAWNVRQINAPAAWGLSTGGGYKVSIIDSGADPNNPDLSYPVYANCVNQNPGVDTFGHGTFVVT